MNPRAAILIRRSKDDSTEKPEEVMRDHCLAYLERGGYQCDPDQDIFLDIGETGGTVHAFKAKPTDKLRVELPLDRPGVKRLFKVLHRYQAVCLYKYDRLGRDQLLNGLIPAVLMSQGVKVLSPIDGDLDPDKPESKMIFNMKGFVAESERIGTRQKTMDATRFMRDSGLVVGNGRPRYGYRYEANNGRKPRAGRDRVKDEITSKVVVRIFKAIADKRSIRSIAAELTADGIPTPMGKRVWNTKAISMIIRDPSYKGDAFQTDHHISLNIKARSKSGKTYTKRVKGTPKSVGESTPAIVEVELWNTANEQLGKRYKPPLASLQCSTWLRGRISCGNCGSRMYLEKRPSGQWIASCGNGRRGSKCWTSAKLSTCEATAWDTLRSGVNHPDLIRNSLLFEKDSTDLDMIEATISNYDKDRRALEARKARVLDHLEVEDDADAIDDLRARQKSLNKEIEGNRRAVEQLRQRLTERDARKAQAEMVMDKVTQHVNAIENADDDLKGNLAEMTSLKVFVTIVGSEKHILTVCCPGGMTLEDLPEFESPEEALMRNGGCLQGMLVEPRGKGNYNRKRKYC